MLHCRLICLYLYIIIIHTMLIKQLKLRRSKKHVATFPKFMLKQFWKYRLNPITGYEIQ